MKQPPENGCVPPAGVLSVTVVSAAQMGRVLEGQAQRGAVEMEKGPGDPCVRSNFAKERVRQTIPLVRE